MNVHVNITNSAEIHNLLQSIPKGYRADVQRAMLKTAVKPLVDRAKQLAPVAIKDHKFNGQVIAKGTLKQSIGVFELKGEGKVAIVVKPRTTGAFRFPRAGWYARIVTTGGGEIKKHRTRNRKRWRTGWAGPKQGRPFMEPAFEQTKDEIARRFDNESIKVFNRITSRLKQQGKI